MTDLQEKSNQLTGRNGQQRVGREPENQETAITTTPPSIIVETTPHQNVDVILRNQRAIQDLKTSMTYGVHYGPPYKNSKKDTLLKPGAEWTQKLFGIRPQFEVLDRIIEPNFDDLSKSWILFRYRCQMIEVKTNAVVGEAIGSCNSLEDKYHWRNGKLTCPHCGNETLIISKRNSQAYWCNTYNGGCGKETPLNAPEITSQQVGKVPNPNPMDLLNTLDKIAQKRAYVSAVLNATAASSIFAPGDDADDIDIIDVSYTEAPDSSTPPAEKPVEKPIAPTPDTPPQLIESRLIDFIGFMYPDDNDKFHRKGTIKALREDKVITPQTSYFDATWQILLRRAFKDYLLDESKVIEALATSAGDETIGDIQGWHKRFDDPKAAWEAAWQAVQDYYATNSPPATAKTGKTDKATDEKVPF
jgi:hypothetical protein